MYKYIILATTLLFFWSCRENPLSSQNDYIDAMQSSYASSKSGSTYRDNIHKQLISDYPILYDWWLQDGTKNNWFDLSLRENLNLRVTKVSKELGLDYSTEILELTDKKLFKLYHKLCRKRRSTRLKEFKHSSDIVFTKFLTLRPSFYGYTEAQSDARGESNFFGGSKLCRFSMNGIWAKERMLLESQNGVIRDPEVHFNGKHLLVSIKSNPEDDFHLYEFNTFSSSLKQLTFGKGVADYEGTYLANGNILFASTRVGTSVDCWYTEVSNLYICDSKGKYIRRVGFDQVHTISPELLEDGRVIYTRWDYNDRGQVFAQPLFTMNADGTSQAAYYGMNSWFPTTMVHARSIPGTQKVMAVFTGHHSPQHGKLGIIDTEAGRDENEGATLIAPIRHTEPERIDSYGQFGEQFQYPYPINSKEFLVSYTPLGYDISDPLFAIYWMDVNGNRELLVSDNKLSCNQPVPLQKRERPRIQSSEVDYSCDSASYYMQDVYEGLAIKGVERGTIKKMRIVELSFRSAGIGFQNNNDVGGNSHATSAVGVGNTSWDVKKVIGTVDIESDGSAYFKVPARRPLYFQVLDSLGRAVQTMRSWSTLQNGEFRSCVGCHEHSNTTPLYTGSSTTLAMQKQIQEIDQEPNLMPGKGFSFAEAVQPILDNHCVRCHNGQSSEPNFLGTIMARESGSKRLYSQSYLSLTHARPIGNPGNTFIGENYNREVNWVSNMSSPKIQPPYSAGSTTSNIIDKLYRGHGSTSITKTEIATISAWLDLGAPFIGSYTEYNNWNESEQRFYEYHNYKRAIASDLDKKNVDAYIQSLPKK